MSKLELDSQRTEADRDLPPAHTESPEEIDRRIQALRAAWAKEHGPLAAVYLRPSAWRRSAMLARRSEQTLDQGSTESPVRASVLNAQPLPGEDRTGEIGDRGSEPPSSLPPEQEIPLERVPEAGFDVGM